MSVAGNVGIVLVGTVVVFFGSRWLETASEGLSSHYGLPAVVQGAVVAAVGSSFPEFATVVIAALAGSFGLGVGGIVGSAIFNILVIPALASLATDEDVESNRTLVYKEAQFYMIAVSAVVITFALAVIYFPASGLRGRVTRELAVIPLGLYGLYVFIQWTDTASYRTTVPPDGTAVRREWARLVLGLGLVLVGVELLVGAVDAIGTTIGAPEFLWGVTILAAATSLPDSLVSVRAARGGNDVASLANVLGSNTFDLLVAVPAGVLIAGTVTIDFAVAVPMLGVLTLATVLLFAALRTGLSLTSAEAYGLLLTYGLFICWMIAEVAGLTGVVPRTYSRI